MRQRVRGWWETNDRATLLALGGYLALAVSPFVIAAAHASFWDHAEPSVVSLLVLALLAALLMRQRWAWRLLVFGSAATLVSFAFDFTTVPALIANLVSLALLLSPQMRRYVRRQQ